MKCLLYQRPTGVARGTISPETLAILMGSGLGGDIATIARQIANFTNPNQPAPLPLAVATAWVNAMATGGLTEAAALALIASKDTPRDALTHAVVEDTALPPEMRPTATADERWFRDAFVWDDTATGKCRCDMAKARLIHLEQIRRARDAELLKLDMPFMAALESGNIPLQQQIAAQKQVLRNIPQTFDLTVFTTPETLKAAWPANLPRR